ncbi:MAG: cation transporter [Caldilineaceae bacterium]
MKTRPNYHLPREQQQKLKRAIVLEWVTIFFILTIIVVMYLTMGASQAMKTAWIEDVLSLIPPGSFLVAMHFRDRQPTANHPYGYRRVTQLAFLMAAVAILGLGLYMIYDSGASLIKGEHPTLGHFNLFGWYPWAGWVMVAALIYSVIPPMVLGRMKLPLGKALHEKTLHADATMNKADWTTGAAAIFGVLGLGLGWWWADAVAAGFISLSVIKDGVTNVGNAIGDLMDRRPTEVASDQPLGLDERLRHEVRRLPGIADAAVRLREEGHVFSGELFVVLHEQDSSSQAIAQKLAEIAQHATTVDWRLYNLVVMPVEQIDHV